MADEEVPLNTKVVNWAKSKIGQRVPDGSCFALVYQALKNAGAKTAYDYGNVTPLTNYVWGAEVNLRNIQAGYVLQFRNHVMNEITEVTGKVEFPDGTKWPWTGTYTKQRNRGHHSAIVAKYSGGPCLYVFEQHVTTPGKKRESVQENMICLDNTDQLYGFPEKPYSLHLNHPADVQKLLNIFKNNKKEVIEMVKKYPKGEVKMEEISRLEWTEVEGIVWAYRPEPK
jgi:hypothetical protein